MKYLNIFVFLFVTFQFFIAQFLHDVIVNFVPSLGPLLMSPSLSEGMRQVVMQPGWSDWPYIYWPDHFNILAVAEFWAILIIPALIFCGPLFIASIFYRYRYLYALPVLVGLVAVTYFHLLNVFNPDPQGALVILFGPIYALVPTSIAAITALVIDRFLVKINRSPHPPTR